MAELTLPELEREMKERRANLAAAALALHMEGLSLREVGKRLQMSHELARQLIKSAQRGE